jgi:hypothetical protein
MMRMSKLREKMDMLMLQIRKYQDTKHPDNPARQKLIEAKALRLLVATHIGMDPRTIKIYLEYLEDFDYIKPLNQYMYSINYKSMTLRDY